MRRAFLIFILIFCFVAPLYAAPCYGTKMPGKKHFFVGLQNYTIFKRYLEHQNGKIRSIQDFLNVSYGVFDWLSIDLKGGAGDVKQHPVSASEVRYYTNFAGGYGFRLKLFDKNNIKSVCGFQHISVHPSSTYVGTVKNKAILDDWQVSFLVSYDFKKITPYIGTRWSRTDYIHKQDGDRKRVKSDQSKSIGLIAGFDLPLSNKIWLNIEGSFFDNEAAAFSLNYSF
ncbi:MAG: hypothetical protein PHW54_01400 [Candidatus Omnitrophica bacterium]|nr:hypothetical protein [Candidatus Omnitrophota bacterium]